MAPLKTNDLQRIFAKLDKNGDGLVSLDELNWLLQRIGVHLSLEELESSVGKQSLNFNEFLFFYYTISEENNNTNMIGEVEEERNDDVESRDLEKAFEVFDLNGDGFISCEELEKVLARLGLWDEKSGKDCRSMICVFDSNFDGLLDFQEFKNMMLSTLSN